MEGRRITCQQISGTREQFECCRIARMSLEEEEMEADEYESDFEESGSDVSDEEDF